MKVKIRKRFIIIPIVLLACLVLAFAARCVLRSGLFFDKGKYKPIKSAEEQYSGSDTNPLELIDSSGNTAETRILVPEGYRRVEAGKDSLLEFMRKMELKPDGSSILSYNGKDMGTSAAAVYAFDIGDEDLQQCADSIIRIYSEYFLSLEKYDEISFKLTNGTEMKYTDWRAGKRLIAFGNVAFMTKLTGYDDSYDCFRAYLDKVMNYAGTKSMYEESTAIDKSKLKAGDILLDKGTGFTGHVVLAVDEAIDENGNKCWLFAQGYMPAQSCHVFFNPAHKDDPWYYEDELGDKIDTMSYDFKGDQIFRWKNGF